MSEQTTLIGEPAAFGCPHKDPSGVVHLAAISKNSMVCGKKRGSDWMGIPTWWESRCEICFETFRGAADDDRR